MDHAIDPQTLPRRQTARLLVTVAAVGSLGTAAWALNRSLRPSVSLANLTVAEVRRGGMAHTINTTGRAPQGRRILSRRAACRP